MQYLTGSQALKFHMGQEFDYDRDFDCIVSEEYLQSIGLSFDRKDSIKKNHEGILYEYINIDFLNNRKLCETSTFFTHFRSPPGERILSLESLYIQKRSHVHRPLSFSKHIQDLQQILGHEEFNGLNDNQKQILEERTRLTKKEFKTWKPKLNVKNSRFFNNAVTRYFVHDDIHKIVAFGDIPLYILLKKDQESAKCEKQLWDNLIYSQQIMCVCEECFVIALERFLIPKIENNERYMPFRMSFDKALEKICTTLTSGWFRDFAIDNWTNIRKIGHDVDFYKLFFDSQHILRRI